MASVANPTAAEAAATTSPTNAHCPGWLHQWCFVALRCAAFARRFGAGSSGANGLYVLVSANSTAVTYRKQASGNQDGVDELYSPPGRFEIHLELSDAGPAEQVCPWW